MLAVVGDIDVDATLEKLEKSFGKVKRGKDVKWPKYAENTPLSEDEVKASDQSEAEYGHGGDGLSHRQHL